MCKTPFYFYDIDLLEKTILQLKDNIKHWPFHVHYALKANAEDKLLSIIKESGFGADCVSGNELIKAVESGFKKESIVLAGVGKTDAELTLAIENNISSINCESIEEIKVIAEISRGKKVKLALRVNPNIDANTHSKITTGTYKDKFGIPSNQLWMALEEISKYDNLIFVGLHFHIGSQITDLAPYKNLCIEVNQLQSYLRSNGYNLPHLNVGGGLGIDYNSPSENSIANFSSYFNIFKNHLHKIENQTIHFELGRSIIAQSGSLYSKVLYIKKGEGIQFAIIDAGMTDLVRPALYNAYHYIENVSSKSSDIEQYEVVGPICESSDSFGKAELCKTKRGDHLKIHSTGAYGQVLTSNYNLRNTPVAYFSDSDILSDLLK